MAKGSGTIHQDVFNEVDNTDPNKPDSTGEDLYFGGWDEINKMHLSQTGDLIESENAKASRDVYGSTAKGEPSPLKKGGKGGE